MSNVYSTRFLGFHEEETPPAYEVPTGYVVVVRDLDVYSAGGVIANWSLSVNGVGIFAAGAFNITATAQTATWRGRQILMPGELLVFAADEALDGLCSGYLLPLP